MPLIAVDLYSNSTHNKDALCIVLIYTFTSPYQPYKCMKNYMGIVCLTSLFISCEFNNTAKSTHSIDNEWKRDSTRHFTLHAQSTLPSADSLQIIGQKVEKIQDELLNLLQENQAQKLEMYFLKDRETLTSYTGFPANAYTDTKKGILYFVDKSPFQLAYRHEIMHALSWRLWGAPKGYWLSEGLAVFASRNCAGYDLHSLAHAISKQGKLVSFNSLIDNFDFRSLEPSLQAASFVLFIYDTYGINTLKGYWQNGLQHSTKLTSISASELERRWKEHIDQNKFNVNIDWIRVRQKGCE